MTGHKTSNGTSFTKVGPSYAPANTDKFVMPAKAFVWVDNIASHGLSIGPVPEVVAPTGPNPTNGAFVRWWPPFDHDEAYPAPTGVNVEWESSLRRTGDEFYFRHRFKWSPPPPSDRIGLTVDHYEYELRTKATSTAGWSAWGTHTSALKRATNAGWRSERVGPSLLNIAGTKAAIHQSVAHLNMVTYHGAARSWHHDGAVEYRIRAAYSNGQNSAWVTARSQAPVMPPPKATVAGSSIIKASDIANPANSTTAARRRAAWDGKHDAIIGDQLPSVFLQWTRNGTAHPYPKNLSYTAKVGAQTAPDGYVYYDTVKMYGGSLNSKGIQDPVGQSGLGPIGGVTETLLQFTSGGGRRLPTLAQVQAGQWITATDGTPTFRVDVSGGIWFLFVGKDSRSYYHHNSGGANDIGVARIRPMRDMWAGPGSGHNESQNPGNGTTGSLSIGDDRWGGSPDATTNPASCYSPFDAYGRVNGRLWSYPGAPLGPAFWWGTGAKRDLSRSAGIWSVFNGARTNMRIFTLVQIWGIYGGVENHWLQEDPGHAGSAPTGTTATGATTVAKGTRHTATQGGAMLRWGPRSGSSSSFTPGPVHGVWTVPANWAGVVGAEVAWHATQYQPGSGTRGWVILASHAGGAWRVVGTQIGASTSPQGIILSSAVPAGDRIGVAAWGTGWQSNVARVPGPQMVLDKVEYISG